MKSMSNFEEVKIVTQALGGYTTDLLSGMTEWDVSPSQDTPFSVTWNDGAGTITQDSLAIQAGESVDLPLGDFTNPYVGEAVSQYEPTNGVIVKTGTVTQVGKTVTVKTIKDHPATWNDPYYTWGADWFDYTQSPNISYETKGLHITNSSLNGGVAVLSQPVNVTQGERVRIDLQWKFAQPFLGQMSLVLTEDNKPVNEFKLNGSPEEVSFNADRDYSNLRMGFRFANFSVLDCWILELSVHVGNVTWWARNRLDSDWQDVTDSINSDDTGTKTYNFGTFGNDLQLKLEVADSTLGKLVYVSSVEIYPFYQPLPDSWNTEEITITIDPSGTVELSEFTEATITFYGTNGMKPKGSLGLMRGTEEIDWFEGTWTDSLHCVFPITGQIEPAEYTYVINGFESLLGNPVDYQNDQGITVE
jgi:hypothetical protein